MRIFKNLFFSLIYLGMAYLFQYLFYEYDDYLNGFVVDNNLDRVNKVFMVIFGICLWIVPHIFAILSAICLIQLSKKKGKK